MRIGATTAPITACCITACLSSVLACAPPLSQAPSVVDRVRRLTKAINEKVDWSSAAGGDVAHWLTGAGASPDVVGKLVGAVRPLADHDTEAFFTEEFYDTEDHMGETVEALTRVLGADAILRNGGREIAVSKLVDGEKSSARLATALDYIDGPLRNDAASLAAHAKSMALDVASLSRVEVQGIRDGQRRINEVELSWVIQAIARDTAATGKAFDTPWISAHGDAVSLGRLVDASLLLYEADVTAPEIPLLTERGYHFLQMLSILFHLFADDPTFGRYSRSCQLVFDALIAELLYRYDDEEMPARLFPVDYVIAAHVLEFLFDDRYYKPAALSPHGLRFHEPYSRLERSILQNLSLVERRVGTSRVLGYAFSMHALHALREMEKALQ